MSGDPCATSCELGADDSGQPTWLGSMVDGRWEGRPGHRAAVVYGAQQHLTRDQNRHLLRALLRGKIHLQSMQQYATVFR
jgi:hypothetical protein